MDLNLYQPNPGGPSLASADPHFCTLFILLARLFITSSLLFPVSAQALWTGISGFVGQSERDWLLDDTVRQADITHFGLSIEEKTRVGLSIGASAGQLSLRLTNSPSSAQVDKYRANFLSFYLRWPLQLTKLLTLHTRFNYQFNLGIKSNDLENTDIEWSEVFLNIGISLQLGWISIRPFIEYRSLDGDITSDNSTRVFELEDQRSSGLILDFYVEPTAFVRLMASSGESQAMMLSFVRQY